MQLSLNLCLYWIVFYMYVYSLAYHKLIQMVIYNVIYIHRMYAKFEYVCCVTCNSKIVFHLDNLGLILCLNDLIFIIELMQSG